MKPRRTARPTQFISFCASALIFSAASLAGSQARAGNLAYSATVLPIVANTVVPNALAINSSGNIVGSSSINIPGGGGPSEAAVLWSNGGVSTVAGPDPTTEYFGRAINNNNEVAGYLTASMTQAFTWTAAGGVQILPVSHGEAMAINDGGTVAGYTVVTDEAFIWSPTGGTQFLGWLGGVASNFVSSANSINDSGTVVGYSTASDGNDHPFIWTQATGMQDILPPGMFQGSAVAINSSGEVLLWGKSAANDLEYAFSWTNAAGFQQLGQFVPTAMNDLGEVVGTMSDGGPPVIWTSGGGVQSLTSLIEPPFPSGTYLETPNGINDSGEIVGFGLSDTSVRSAFLLTPVPEPGSLVLAVVIACCCCCVVLQHKRKTAEATPHP